MCRSEEAFVFDRDTSTSEVIFNDIERFSSSLDLLVELNDVPKGGPEIGEECGVAHQALPIRKLLHSGQEPGKSMRQSSLYIWIEFKFITHLLPPQFLFKQSWQKAWMNKLLYQCDSTFASVEKFYISYFPAHLNKDRSRFMNSRSLEFFTPYLSLWYN